MERIFTDSSLSLRNDESVSGNGELFDQHEKVFSKTGDLMRGRARNGMLNMKIQYNAAGIPGSKRSSWCGAFSIWMDLVGRLGTRARF
jgi:hypothetical protein